MVRRKFMTLTNDEIEFRKKDDEWQVLVKQYKEATQQNHQVLSGPTHTVITWCC